MASNLRDIRLLVSSFARNEPIVQVDEWLDVWRTRPRNFSELCEPAMTRKRGQSRR